MKKKVRIQVDSKERGKKEYRKENEKINHKDKITAQFFI